MSDARLDRVRNDLDVMRQAAGLELPFGWEDVWLALALVPCGAILSLAGAFGPLGSVRLALLPVLPVLLAMIWLRYRFRRGSGRAPARRREYTLGLVAGLVLGLVAGAYLAWAKRLGEPIQVSGGMAVAMSGALCLVLALTTPGRRSLFAAAAALFAYGAAIPFCSPRQVVVGGGLALVFTGLVSAWIQASQLRSLEADHEPAAH